MIGVLQSDGLIEMNLSGKCAYVSGGTSGIGLAAAEAFAAMGADLFLFSVDKSEMRDRALERVDALRVRGDQRFEAIELDVTDEKKVAAALGKAATEFGAPHVLINSAGIGGAVYFDQEPFDRFDKMMKINVYGIRHVTAALAPHMGPGGQIVNVASFSGLIGLAGYTSYSCTKFAVVGFSMALRGELKRRSINVSVLCPPQVDTPMLGKTDPFKPPEVKALNDRAGVMSAEDVVGEMIKGMNKKRGLIIPGGKTRLFHLVERFAPALRERIADRALENVRKAHEKK
jgi:3-dehydrosphinganine reductase